MLNPRLAAAAVAGIGLLPGLSVMGQAVAALYGITSRINDFVNQHLEDMKASSNPTVERTGRILEMAKYGFGLGYLSSVTVIAVGQFLLAIRSPRFPRWRRPPR